MTRHSSAKCATAQPARIVVLGNGAVFPGVYKSLQKKLQDKRNMELTIVSQLSYHVCYALMGECISGAIDHKNLVMPVASCFARAKHIHAYLLAIYPRTKQLQVRTANGRRLYIHYDHLIVDEDYFNDEVTDGRTTTGFTIQSVWDIMKTKKQLEYLVEKAEASGNGMNAARILRVCVASEGASGIELAAYIGRHLLQLCRKCQLFTNVKPQVYLVASKGMFDKYTSPVKNYVSDQLTAAHVKIIHNKIVRVNTSGAVMQDGSYISCSLVYNTQTQRATRSLADQIYPAHENARPSIDKYSRLKGHENIWLTTDPETDPVQTLPSPMNYASRISKGKYIAKNITRSLDNLQLLPAHPIKKQIWMLGTGRDFAQIGVIKLTGLPASLYRWVTILLHMPSFERKNYIKKSLYSDRK